MSLITKVDRKDIEVTVESNHWIRLSFDKKLIPTGFNDDDATGGSTFIIQERKSGNIERVLQVPISADMQSPPLPIQYKDGVLYIQFKKKIPEKEDGRKLLVE